MATAILKGAIGKEWIAAEDILIYDVNADQCEKIKALAPVVVAKDNKALVQSCDFVVLAVKPVYVAQVLSEIQPYVHGKRIISIAAGWTMDMLKNILNKHSGAQVLRVMPNTPAMVGEGFTAICEETTFDEESFSLSKKLFQALGEVSVFPERLFDAVIAVSGSSPAYIYMVIEAMADGAVKLGLPRQSAYRAAAQAVLGAAKMVLETGEHPAKLKDDVCSPGGTTIEAAYQLERGGLRGTIIAAMEACAKKSQQMANEQIKG